MFRKIILFVAAFVFVLGAVATPAASQTPEPEVFDFEKAYEDYIFVSETYSKLHSDYLLARAQYLQASTLASQTKARDATALMLEARDDVITTYLTALRLKLSEANGVSDSDKQGLFTRLDSEVAWFAGHKGRVSSAGTLEDLVNDSKEALSRFVEITEGLSYEVLSAVPTGEVRFLRNTQADILSRLKTKIGEIRINGDHDPEKADRWVIETENKITRSLDKEIEAQALAFTLREEKTKNKASTYNNVTFRIQESLQFLKDASSFLKEVVKEIKTAN